MSPPVRGQGQVIRDDALNRGEHPRPVAIELPIVVPQHGAASDGDCRVPVVVAVPTALAHPCPQRVVLCAVDLNEGVRTHPEIEPANASNPDLLFETHAGIREPQSCEGLTVGFVQRAHESAPALHALGGTPEECVQLAR